MLRKASLALAALVIAASIGAGAVAQEQNGSAPHGPPAGPGLTLINERCSACHATEQVLGVRKAPDDWASTVQSMIDRGADLNADEQKAVVAYLATNFSTAPTPSGGAPQQTAPATPPQPKPASH